MKKTTANLCCKFAVVFLVAVAPKTACAFMSLTLSGKASTSNSQLQETKARSGSASVDFDLGAYFRIGFSYDQEYTEKKGYTQVGTGTKRDSFREFYVKEIENIASVDLTLVLFNGQVFVPYIFGGIARISGSTVMINESESEQGKYTESDVDMPATGVPTGGAGFGLRLNRDFMIKFSNRWTPGQHYNPVTELPETTLDSSAQVGISLQI